MLEIKFKRIFHPWNKWEDYEYGFYENCSGDIKNQMLDNAIEMFNDEQKTIECMNKVIEIWPNSCEHNLTNEGMNKIAYIGQAACCIYKKVPSTITMEAWSLLSNEVKERSNKIAEEVLLKWGLKNKNKLEHA